MNNAGDLVCKMLDLDPDEYVHMREAENIGPSFVDCMDIVQIYMHPILYLSRSDPEQKKALDKDMALEIINDVYYEAKEILLSKKCDIEIE